MDEVTVALAAQLDELRDLVADLGDRDWSRPSACPGWSLADVLLHLAQTNEVATASATGTFGDAIGMWRDTNPTDVDATADLAVERERGVAGSEIHARWLQSADDMVGAFSTGDPARRVPWVVGEMAARTLATTRIAETWIHTADIAVGLGVEHPPTDRLWHVARLVHRTVPYAFSRADRDLVGSVRFELTGPSGDAWVFGPGDAPTVVTGTALDLCRVAGQRAIAADTSLGAVGPDAADVLELMRTFA